MAKKILLAEDEEIMRNLLKDKLIKEGYEVLVSNNGEEALKMMQETKPDLVLLDIVMPQKGGFEVMEEMKKSPVLSSIPIIIISNSGQIMELEKAKELGAKDWLVKTEFNPQEVINKVIKQIGK